jgi:signal transduction histidine kinase
MLGGVASGLARRLGKDPGLVRVILTLSVLASGVGAAAYMVAWLALPMEGTDHNIWSRVRADRRGIALAIAFAPLAVLTLVVTSALGEHYLSTTATVGLLSCAGLLLIYRNAEDDERLWLRHLAESYLRLTPSSQKRHRSLALRIVGGIAVLGIGLALLTTTHDGTAALRPLAGLILFVCGLVLLFGPWWLRLGQDLLSERQARIRAEERADMAARVHDSVLQTLALIQRNSADPAKVEQLARGQERELRSWLFEGRLPGSAGEAGPSTLVGGAELIAREVEAAHGARVEVVTVGDCPLDEDLLALLAAGREATVNAAKWSGAPSVSLFTEVEADRVSMFVRDRGAGFDPESVAADRRGVTESIRGRMSRHGGSAEIRTAPGEGTEVELRLPRRPVRP